MRRRRIALPIVWLAACAVLAGADFWEEKELTDWSDGDVRRMMSNSPWAKRITVVFPRAPRAAIDDSVRGAQRGRGGGGGFGGGDAFGAGPQSRLIVQWRSALPMRQALVRGRIGEGGAIDSAGRQLVALSPDAYFIVVSGLPRGFARNPAALEAWGRLERRGKPPIRSLQAGPQPEGDGLALMYLFPRDDAITLEDEEVEFVTDIAGTTIERRFELEDMMVHGRLEL